MTRFTQIFLQEMNLRTVFLLLSSAISLSPTGTNTLQIGIHLGVDDADLIHAAYLRVSQLNQITNLIDPNTKLSLVYIQSNNSESETLKAGNDFANLNVAAVIGAGKSNLSPLLSIVLQDLGIPQW